MRQMTFAMAGFERYSKTTRRAAFLAEMERVVPWPQLCALIDPFYPQAGNGRPPVGLERMLRIYFLQHWFNLSDPSAEEVRPRDCTRTRREVPHPRSARQVGCRSLQGQDVPGYQRLIFAGTFVQPHVTLGNSNFQGSLLVLLFSNCLSEC